MKSIGKFILFLFVCCFTFYPKVKADISEAPLTFELLESFYSDVVLKNENDTYVFYYTNNLLNMNLTDNQLKSILSQKSGNGSSRLTYYETLNIKVKAVEGTDFESLKNKSKVFRANGGGAWVDSISHNQSMETSAEKYDLNNNFWPWGFKIQYRLTPSSSFTSTIPSGKDLNNKTLEEQLATVLDLDLDANPDSVVDQYKTLWRFNPLPEGYTFLIRYDFFDNKPDVTPILKEDTTDEYLTNSLKLLDTEYVAIKYDRTGELPTGLISEDDNNYKHNFLLFGISASILLVSSVIYYIKKNKIKIIPTK